MASAVILNPGPSLALLESVPPCDLSIAVNRAALRFECSWWAAMDYPMLRDNRNAVLGNPSLLTFSTTWNDIGKRLKPFPFVVLREDMVPWLPITDAVRWDWCTFTAALVFAAWHGATRIDVYGCDLSGAKDYDGVEAGLNRTPERWIKEFGVYNAVKQRLAERGVEITRHMNHAHELRTSLSKQRVREHLG